MYVHVSHLLPHSSCVQAAAAVPLHMQDQAETWLASATQFLADEEDDVISSRHVRKDISSCVHVLPAVLQQPAIYQHSLVCAVGGP